MDDNVGVGKPSGLRRKASLNITFCVKKEKSSNYKKIYAILQKSEHDRTAEENKTLENSASIVKEVALRLERKQRLKSRSEEIEDQPSVLEEKCRLLANALLNAQHLVVYSGAGVSTAARIPDYRGTNGIWTRLQQGKDIGCHDLSQAEPTLTHMALFALYNCGKLKHVVSQNCDGLHLRSGIPRTILSEVHGNMNLEVCTTCKLEYWRLFDVTEHTGRYCHETARLCIKCRKPLRDTIVHFGERGALKWPINWKGACDNADKADIILCIGSSLKVLKRYPWLWCMDKPVKKRPLLFIVNLQWTPKDDHATLKINGKCDKVMSHVMSYLGMNIPKYVRHLDPIFVHATILHEVEVHTTSQPLLQLGAKKEITESIENSSDVDIDHKENVDSDLIVECKKDIDSDENILVKNEIYNIDELRMDFVEEEVIITTTINDEDILEKECQIIECINMEIESGIQEVVIESTNVSVSGFNSGPVLVCNNDSEKITKKENLIDNHILSNRMKSENNALWRPFYDSSNKNNLFNSEPGCSSFTNVNRLNSFVRENKDKSLSDNFEKLSSSNILNLSNSINTNRGIKTNFSTKTPQENNSCNEPCDDKKRHNCNLSKVCLDSDILQLQPLDLSLGKSLCKFCLDNLNSGKCQFYKQLTPVIPDVGPFCYCCYEDESDNENPDDKSIDKSDKNNSDKTSTDKKAESSTDKVPIVNPGWFGKGYRKRTKKKK